MLPCKHFGRVQNKLIHQNFSSKKYSNPVLKKKKLKFRIRIGTKKNSWIFAPNPLGTQSCAELAQTSSKLALTLLAPNYLLLL